MAMHYNSHILVIDNRGVFAPVLYPKAEGMHFDGRSTFVDELGLVCRTGNQKVYEIGVPDVAFMVDTLVVIFNGINHYWCTKSTLGGDRATQLAQMQNVCQFPILKVT